MVYLNNKGKKYLIALLLSLSANTLLEASAARICIDVRKTKLLNYENSTLQQQAPNVAEYKKSYQLPGIGGQELQSIKDFQEAKTNILNALSQADIHASLHTIHFQKKGGFFMKSDEKIIDCTKINIDNNAIRTPLHSKEDPIYTNQFGDKVSKNLTFETCERVNREELLSKIPSINNKSWRDLTVKEVTDNFLLTFDFSDPTKYTLTNTLDQIAPLETEVLTILNFKQKTLEEKEKDQNQKSNDLLSSKRNREVNPTSIIVICIVGGSSAGYVIYEQRKRAAEKEELEKNYRLRKGL